MLDRPLALAATVAAAAAAAAAVATTAAIASSSRMRWATTRTSRVVPPRIIFPHLHGQKEKEKNQK